MNLHATQIEPADPPRGAAMKFTYPSGSTPLGGYTIKRGVGRGGFGEVYYGTSDAGKEVGLKLIRRNLDVELRGVKQCLNLKHPNLIGLYDIRTDDQDDRWVVMEFVSGESLEEAIDRNPQGMPRDEVLYWMHGIAAGVAYLHDHGIVHRDLKPGNIFSDEGTVKIGDYGLAKFISCSRRSGQTESVGTVHYMAPEIANGRYGREIDTYALGIILYEMLTGNVPFEGESVGEVLMKHLTAEPNLSQLDEPFRTIVSRALAKDPQLRISSVREMIVLLPPLEGSPVHVASPSPSRRANYDPQPAAANGAAVLAAARPVAKAEIVPEDDEDDEPILKALRDGWSYMESQWREAELHPLVRAGVVVAVIILLVSQASILLTMLVGSLIMYAIYRGVRALVVPPKRKVRPIMPAPQAAAPPTRHAPAPQPRRKRPLRRSHSWRSDPAPIPAKAFKQHMTELVGSMLLAALIATTMAILITILRGDMIDAGRFVWLATVGSLGAWAVLIPAKFWEREDGDQAMRRFTMLVAGLVVGVGAYLLASVLLVDLPYGFGMRSSNVGAGFFDSSMRDQLHRPDGSPTLLIYLAYFGFLFLVLRWWRQADPRRQARLSLWGCIWCVAWAYVLFFFWSFPQPWGMMLAAIIAVSVQLASPWTPQARRASSGAEV